MRERAMTVGADLRIESEMGMGTEVVVFWPSEERARLTNVTFV